MREVFIKIVVYFGKWWCLTIVAMSQDSAQKNWEQVDDILTPHSGSRHLMLTPDREDPILVWYIYSSLVLLEDYSRQNPVCPPWHCGFGSSLLSQSIWHGGHHLGVFIQRPRHDAPIPSPSETNNIIAWFRDLQTEHNVAIICKHENKMGRDIGSARLGQLLTP